LVQRRAGDEGREIFGVILPGPIAADSG
jgi:hypothetical protein